MNDERTQIPNIQVNNNPTADHDLLIRLDEKVDNKFKALAVQIDNLSENLVDRVDQLETEFKDYRDNNDSKVLSLQRLVYIGLGIVLAIQFVLTVYVTYFHASV
jgi:hypothetical protein